MKKSHYVWLALVLLLSSSSFIVYDRFFSEHWYETTAMRLKDEFALGQDTFLIYSEARVKTRNKVVTDWETPPEKTLDTTIYFLKNGRQIGKLSCNEGSPRDRSCDAGLITQVVQEGTNVNLVYSDPIPGRNAFHRRVYSIQGDQVAMPVSSDIAVPPSVINEQSDSVSIFSVTGIDCILDNRSSRMWLGSFETGRFEEYDLIGQLRNDPALAGTAGAALWVNVYFRQLPAINAHIPLQLVSKQKNGSDLYYKVDMSLGKEIRLSVSRDYSVAN